MSTAQVFPQTRIRFEIAIPILRIFSVEKTKEFYVDYLGFKIDWEHRLAEGLPLYMQVSRDNLVLHLSEHVADCTPGSTVLVETNGVEDLHKELQAKNYKYLNPGVEITPWNAKVLSVIDPFGNRIRFHEQM